MNDTEVTRQAAKWALERLTEVLELVEGGLYTDGAHHKQWFLEQIARAALGGNEEAFATWAQVAMGDEDDPDNYYGEWEAGIAP